MISSSTVFSGSKAGQDAVSKMLPSSPSRSQSSSAMCGQKGAIMMTSGFTSERAASLPPRRTVFRYSIIAAIAVLN